MWQQWHSSDTRLGVVFRHTQGTDHLTITPPSQASHEQGPIPTPQPGWCWALSWKDFSDGCILSSTASLVTNTVRWKYFSSQICYTDSLHLWSSALELLFSSKLLFFPSTEHHKKFQKTFPREHAKATAIFSWDVSGDKSSWVFITLQSRPPCEGGKVQHNPRSVCVQAEHLSTVKIWGGQGGYLKSSETVPPLTSFPQKPQVNAAFISNTNLF